MALTLIERLNKEPEIDHSLPPCPFCGSPAEVQFWHGGRASKRLISCSNTAGTLFGSEGKTCHVGPGVTGETLKQARERWSQRAPVHAEV